MSQIRIGAITDEFSPDLTIAADAMHQLGMETAELRMVFGKNILDLSNEEVDRALEILGERHLQVLAIASPLLKCTLPDAPEVDSRFQQDIFASRHTYEDQPRLTERAFEIAHRCGAKMIRVFSYWRVVKPEAIFPRMVSALRDLAEKAEAQDLVILIENEHACNIATARETAKVLAAIDHPNLQVVWDPANAYVSGEVPYPDGYSMLPVRRIGHVHAKDCKLEGHKAHWCALGEGDVDWRGQVQALRKDGYQGAVHLETHWTGPGRDKFEGSKICGRNLIGLLG